MFLSRLNESSGGCEKILPVSLSFWSNLKFFKWNSFPSVTFVVLTVDQPVEHGVELC